MILGIIIGLLIALLVLVVSIYLKIKDRIIEKVITRVERVGITRPKMVEEQQQKEAEVINILNVQEDETEGFL